MRFDAHPNLLVGEQSYLLTFGSCRDASDAGFQGPTCRFGLGYSALFRCCHDGREKAIIYSVPVVVSVESDRVAFVHQREV